MIVALVAPNEVEVPLEKKPLVAKRLVLVLLVNVPLVEKNEVDEALVITEEVANTFCA